LARRFFRRINNGRRRIADGGVSGNGASAIQNPPSANSRVIAQPRAAVLHFKTHFEEKLGFT